MTESRKRIALALSEELAIKLKEASKATGLPMAEIVSQVVSSNLESWVGTTEARARDEVILTIVDSTEERRLRGKDKCWAIERCMNKHPDITLTEMALLGRYLQLKPNWVVRKWNELQANQRKGLKADPEQ